LLVRFESDDILARTKVIDNLYSRETEGIGLAYFHCDYADYETLSAPKIFGPIARQLRECIDIPIGVEQDSCFKQGNLSLSAQDVSRILHLILRRYSTVYQVFDGLDKCGREEHIDLLRAISAFGILAEIRIKTIISSRGPAEDNYGLDISHTISLNEARNSSDIREYVRESVSSLQRSGRLDVQNESLVNDIIDMLCEKAHGMLVFHPSLPSCLMLMT
jgi:hypothetical protein